MSFAFFQCIVEICCKILPFRWCCLLVTFSAIDELKLCSRIMWRHYLLRVFPKAGIIHVYTQGRGNDFYPRGAWILWKVRFCKFSKFLPYKSSILRTEAWAPLGPPPLILFKSFKKVVSDSASGFFLSVIYKQVLRCC